MTKEELIEKLDKCNEHDPRRSHANADWLLIDYINDKEITEAFGRVNKSYL